MSDLASNVNNKINNLYNSSTLFEKYGVDVWITIIVISGMLFAIGYYHMLNHIHSLKKDWVKIRCNPLYMPFAGFINKDPNFTKLESTFSNFVDCLSNIVKEDTKIALDPVYYNLTNLTNIFNGFSKTFDMFRKMIAYLRKSFQKFYTDIVTRIVNICIPLLMIFVKLKDSMSKMIGILTASMFAYLIEYRVMKIYILNIGVVLMLEVFVPLLISTIISLVTAFALLPIPFAGWAAFLTKLAIALPPIAILIMIFTFLCILIVFTNQVYKDTIQGMPPHPPLM